MPDSEQQLGVLLVDDEPNNVEILKLYLEDEGWAIFTAGDGLEGWDILQLHKTEINVILLDRMMPNMDGMQFMKRLNTDESVASIPVIMQTAAAEKEQVAEGIAAGVYYYLAKPFDEDVLLSITRAAMADSADLHTLQNELNEHQSTHNLVKECHFEISTLDDIRYLSIFLANFYPDPERVVLGISELLLNSVEHGNLALSYEGKTRLMLENIWEQEVRRLQSLPEHKHKKVQVLYKRDSTSITLHIKDEGNGFDWNRYLEIEPDRATHCHGRGVAISKKISFDTLEYKGCGNEVLCTILLE